MHNACRMITFVVGIIVPQATAKWALVERSADGRSNPMVNAGAIAATSLVPGDSGAAKCGCSATGYPVSPGVTWR